MNIGLYFGTFNPIHIGHLIIANHLVEHSEMEEIWMVVTPHNPLKKKSTLLDDYQRLELVHLATENYEKIRPSDIEFKLPQPSYTTHTLSHLRDKFPQHNFSLIMGEDNLKSLHKWKNYEHLMANHTIYVYPRIAAVDDAHDFSQHPNVHMIDAPIVEISSTFIRENIKANKNVQPMLSAEVWQYIDKNNLYRK